MEEKDFFIEELHQRKKFNGKLADFLRTQPKNFIEKTPPAWASQDILVGLNLWRLSS